MQSTQGCNFYNHRSLSQHIPTDPLPPAACTCVPPKALTLRKDLPDAVCCESRGGPAAAASATTGSRARRRLAPPDPAAAAAGGGGSPGRSPGCPCCRVLLCGSSCSCCCCCCSSCSWCGWSMPALPAAAVAIGAVAAGLLPRQLLLVRLAPKPLRRLLPLLLPPLWPPHPCTLQPCGA